MPNLRRFLSRRWLLGFLAAAALLFGLMILHPYPRQSLFGPTIRGEPWCVWEERVRRQFGAPPYPLFDRLQRWLGVEPKPLPLEELFDHPEMAPLMVALLDDPDQNVRLFSAGEIVVWQSLRDRSALPALHRMMNDAQLDAHDRLVASEAIWRIDRDQAVLRWIVKQLDHSNPRARELAMGPIARLCDDAPELFPLVFAHAKDPSAPIRCRVIDAMVHFGERGRPILIDGLRDVDPQVRGWALTYVEHMEPKAKWAIPIVESLLTDVDPGVASHASVALQRIDPARYRQLKAERKIE